MLRSMTFMDHMNFEISLQKYYATLDGVAWPKIDYDLLFRKVSTSKGMDHVKGYIFAPKPDDFLMQDTKLHGNYKWLLGLANKRYIDVVFGRYLARPTNDNKPMDISDRSSYYKVEKGTDINLALNAISKAQYNSYDTAFIYSVDSDYINVYRQLKSMGKIVVIVTGKGQYISKDIIPEIDDFILLDNDFLCQCSMAGK